MEKEPHNIIQSLLDTDPDWVNFKRCGNSLSKMLERYPNGCPVHVIASALMLSEEEVQELHIQLIQYLKQCVGEDYE